MNYTILVTGSKGQLGNEMQLIAQNYPNIKFIFTDVEELDILDRVLLDEIVVRESIDYIVNCAAFTAVDKAEYDEEKCYQINCTAVRNIAETASKYNIKVIHISTDYVYDGTSYTPYTEEMIVSPKTVYGKSKLAGEIELFKVCPDSVVLRTSWLYSTFGNNFVNTMIKLGKERDNLNVIFDQIGTPTYAADLSDVIMKIITADKFIPGVFHYSNEGVCSWFDFAKTIHRIAQIKCNVHAVETKDYPTKTPRPYYSVLNKAKIKQTYLINIPYWEESLNHCINTYLYHE